MTDPPLDFTRYVAFGDSISIDAYPLADVARRHPGRASTERLGAASLLLRNDDQLWPEFARRDLASLNSHDSIEFVDHTADGATTQTLLRQVSIESGGDQRVLVTVTAGGNDLLGEIGFNASATVSPVPAIAARLESAVTSILKTMPRAVLLVATVYDPSDGTAKLPGIDRTLHEEANWLNDYNEFIRRLAALDDRVRIADIHAHFLGHGLSAAVSDRWYLHESIIEPNARGASEVRRVWLECLGL